jgi:hypothetical protein
MKHLFIFEDFPAVYHDPIYASDTFKIRFKATNDLSNKKPNDTINVPVNDLLDDYHEGDFIEGEDEDGKKHRGKIVKIKRDDKGDGAEVCIDEDGETISLVVSTISLYQDGKVGNREAGKGEAPQGLDADTQSDAAFYGASYEGKSLRHLKKFSSI